MFARLSGPSYADYCRDAPPRPPLCSSLFCSRLRPPAPHYIALFDHKIDEEPRSAPSTLRALGKETPAKCLLLLPLGALALRAATMERAAPLQKGCGSSVVPSPPPVVPAFNRLHLLPVSLCASPRCIPSCVLLFSGMFPAFITPLLPHHPFAAPPPLCPFPFHSHSIPIPIPIPFAPHIPSSITSHLSWFPSCALRSCFSDSLLITTHSTFLLDGQVPAAVVMPGTTPPPLFSLPSIHSTLPTIIHPFRTYRICFLCTSQHNHSLLPSTFVFDTPPPFHPDPSSSRPSHPAHIASHPIPFTPRSPAPIPLHAHPLLVICICPRPYPRILFETQRRPLISS
ncbi:hypothetical protein C8J57DRAFT_1578728 [Mycena rebaudengoi]|nr:hypothetical protein C8J57DRAFT_1578728 [Mycena rebaudengoi]